MIKFIAIAPILQLKSLGSQFLVKCSKSSLFYKTLTAAGPEIMTDAEANGFLSLAFT
jgi:hypothetical protein